MISRINVPRVNDVVDSSPNVPIAYPIDHNENSIDQNHESEILQQLITHFLGLFSFYPFTLGLGRDTPPTDSPLAFS